MQYLHCALAAVQCIVIGTVCEWVDVYVCVCHYLTASSSSRTPVDLNSFSSLIYFVSLLTFC